MGGNWGERPEETAQSEPNHQSECMLVFVNMLAGEGFRNTKGYTHESLRTAANGQGDMESQCSVSLPESHDNVLQDLFFPVSQDA